MPRVREIIENAPHRIGTPEEFTVHGRKVIKTVYRPPDADNLLAFVLDGVFTPSECEEWIRMTESQGYEPALVNIGAGRQMLMTDVRNNSRCIIDSVEMAARIQKYIQPFLPETCELRPLFASSSEQIRNTNKKFCRERKSN